MVAAVPLMCGKVVMLDAGAKIGSEVEDWICSASTSRRARLSVGLNRRSEPRSIGKEMAPAGGDAGAIPAQECPGWGDNYRDGC
jgi:hypothetical protein